MSDVGRLALAAIPSAGVAGFAGSVLVVGQQVFMSPEPVNAAGLGVAAAMIWIMGWIATLIGFVFLIIVALPLTYRSRFHVSANPIGRGIPLVLFGAGLGIVVVRVLDGWSRDLSIGDSTLGAVFGASVAIAWLFAVCSLFRWSKVA